MTSFISKDKKTITLPVALGETVYVVNILCGDFCTPQREKFDKVFPKKPREDRCSWDRPCQTVANGVRKMEVTLKNVEYILKQWNINCFATFEEAEETTKKRVEKNRKIMADYGFTMTEDGRSTW